MHLMEARLKEVQRYRREGKALPSGLLPTYPDVMAALTGSDDAVSYMIEVCGSLWEQQQCLAQQLRDLSDTLAAHGILIKQVQQHTQEGATNEC